MIKKLLFATLTAAVLLTGCSVFSSSDSGPEVTDPWDSGALEAVGLADLPRPNENITVVGETTKTDEIDSITGEKYTLNDLTVAFLNTPYENYLTELADYLSSETEPLYEESSYFGTPQKVENNPYEDQVKQDLLNIANQNIDILTKEIYPSLYKNGNQINLIYAEDMRSIYQDSTDSEDIATNDLLDNFPSLKDKMNNFKQDLEITTAPYKLHILSIEDPEA